MANTNLKNDACTTNCRVSQKKRYEDFSKDVEYAKAQLASAEDMATVYNAINYLETLIEKSIQDCQLKDLHNILKEADGAVKSMRMGDCTRKQIKDVLDKMLGIVKEFIEKEDEKENVERVRKFFFECADHAEQISALIDFKKIWG